MLSVQLDDACKLVDDVEAAVNRRTFSIFERMLDNERRARCELRLREGS